MQIPDPVPDFAYFDGAKIVHADRLAIMRQLLIRTRGRPNDLPNKIYAVKPDTTDINMLTESWEAAEQLVLLVRDLFQMQPFDRTTGAGARDEHCWTVWEAFCEAMDESKKNAAILPISAPLTESLPASPQPGTSTSASS